MENFILDRNNKIKEFGFNSKNSNLLIKSVSLLLEENNNLSWMELILSIKLKAELRYIVYKDNLDRFSDERMKQLPIHLIVDVNQTQPIFNINQQFRNDILKIGWNSDEKFYSTIKIELIEDYEINENYSLEFIYEML